MNDNEIKITFIYESQQEEILICKPDEKMKEICLKIATKVNRDFNSLVFLFNGKPIDNSNYDKPINNYISDLNSVLKILVYNSPKSTVLTSVQVDFFFKSEITKIQCNLTDKLSDLAQSFANQKGLNYLELIFYHGNKKLDLSKTIREIESNQDILDRKIITIDVKINEITSDKESFFSKNKIKIIIVGVVLVILIIIIIILITFLLGKNKKKENEKKETEEITTKNKCNDRCSLCDNSNQLEECVICLEEFELYEGKCIPYAFSVTYRNDYNQELVELFNPEIIKDLLLIKLDDQLINPTTSEFYLNQEGNDTVYFYFWEYVPISLSYMFSNNTKLINFSFNEKYINNFYIPNMDGMFSGCSSLINISFHPFHASHLINISNAFSNCTSLK